MLSFKRYVDIESGVGAGAGVTGRNFGTRIFTENVLIPPQSYIEFGNAADVATYFGAASEEAARALFYFGFISKRGLSPTLLSFARWTNAAVAPLIFGNTTAKTLTQFTGINAGGFTLTIGGTPVVVAALNLSAAGSLAVVAADVQAALRAVGGPAAGCNVTYDAVRGCFDFASVITGAAAITVTDGAQTPAAALGWAGGPGLILSPGSALESLTQTLTASASASNNFGGFAFTDACGLNLAQVEEIAAWNHGQGVNFMYLQKVTAANAAAWMPNFLALTGGAYTLDSPAGTTPTQYPGMLPGMIWGATDYTRRAAAQNYMYQVAALTPSVTDDTTANTYDAERLNYYGATQNAGKSVAFYQRGYLTGPSTSPPDMGIYANESWLKDAAGTAMLSLLLSLGQIPANATGRSYVLTTLTQGPIQDALNNGTIESGKTLTPVQQNYITSVTGDANAWRQVQGIGYWLDVSIVPVVVNNITEYQAEYTLVYSKADSIRKVTGNHILI